MTMAPSDQLSITNSLKSAAQAKEDHFGCAYIAGLYTAAFLTVDSTSKEETVDLVAHMATVFRLAKDRRGSQWIQCDNPTQNEQLPKR